MSLDSIDKDSNEEQAFAEEGGSVISYALDALSELNGGEDAPLPQPPAIAQVPAPAAEQKGLANESLGNLQSALDWYKDWLSSI